MMELVDNCKSARRIYNKLNPVVIMDVVSTHCGISISELKGLCRRKEISYARHLTMYFMYYYTSMSLLSIGEIFNRDHTTVYHAKEVIDDKIENYSDTSEEVGILLKKIINMNIYVNSENDVRPELSEAVFLLKYLRRSTKSYDSTPNYLTRQQKKEWEEKADEFLKKVSTK